MERTITFNKSGYDPFIDFIKAYAIVCVLLGHTIPYLNYWGYGLWAGMQVPLFVLIQSFHFLKRDHPSLSFKKIIWRVLIPYIFIQSLVFFYILCRYEGVALQNQLVSFIKSGGKGPGSYYPWIYIQIAILLPFINRMVSKGTKKQLVVTFLIISELFEIVFSLIDMPDYIYRLLAIRYFFLFFLAWVWAKEGVVINSRTIILSIISFLSIVYFEYLSIDDEILFFNTAWKYHRWPCYYFVATGGMFLLNNMYMILIKNVIVSKIIKLLAQCSYEIFLIQMLLLYLYPEGMIVNMFARLGIVSNIVAGLLSLITKVLIVFATSVITGYYFNIFYNRCVKY